MECPRCKTPLPADEARLKPPPTSTPAQPVAATAEEAMRADAPPGPCPQCGWSTMWNE